MHAKNLLRPTSSYFFAYIFLVAFAILISASSANASTQTAIDQQANTFHTDGTLTTTDLQNRASYHADAEGLSLGAGLSTDGKLAPAGTGAGIGSDGGELISVTRSGISGIAGQQDVRTGDKASGIGKIFDANRVQQDVNAQVQITQTFSQYAPQAVANYADKQKAELTSQAEKEADPAKRAALLAEAQQWSDGGNYRVALHTATGGLAGGLSGAVGAGTVAAAAPLMNELQSGIEDKLTAAGVNPTVAKSASQVIALTTAATTGALVSGGSLQGAAAGLNVDANNRQLHPDERKFIEKKSKELAAQTCKAGDVQCTNAAQRYWSDQLTAEAEATDDSKLAQQRQAYLKQVAATGQAPGLEGQTSGGAEKYLSDAQTARNALNEIRGQNILGTDGKPIIADGSSLTYFGGTQAQRDDHNLYAVRPGPYDKRVSANGSANSVVPQQDGILRDQRGANRLENLRATNGATLADYPVESFVVGGGIQAIKTLSGLTLKSIVSGTEEATTEVVATGIAKERAIAAPQSSSVRSSTDSLLPEADFSGRGAVRADLSDHLNLPSISGKQIAGGHDLNEFNMALNKVSGTILSKLETGPGIYEIQYQLPHANSPAIKTVFDPVKYPNIENMANTAANKGLLEFQLTGNAAPTVEVNGLNFDVRIAVRPGEPPSVRTAYPIGSAK